MGQLYGLIIVIAIIFTVFQLLFVGLPIYARRVKLNMIAVDDILILISSSVLFDNYPHEQVCDAYYL